MRGVAKRVPHDPVTSLPDQVRLAKIIPTIDGQNEGAIRWEERPPLGADSFTSPQMMDYVLGN